MTWVSRQLITPVLWFGLVTLLLLLTAPLWPMGTGSFSIVRGAVATDAYGAPNRQLGETYTDVTSAADQTSILLGIGADSSERRLSWLTKSTAKESVQLAAGAHETMPSDATTIDPTQRGHSADPGRDYLHATLTELRPGTYSYRVGSDEGSWSEIAQFDVYPQDEKHTFTFFADPQLGSSGNVRNDSEGWQRALDAHDRLFPESQFLLSAGDHVETYSGDLDEYRAYLGPDQLRTQTFAHTLGNHDYNRSRPQELFQQHFNRPNLADYDPTGGTYWFTYNGVLHLSLSTEYDNWEEHRAFLESTIDEHAEAADWTILTFHRPLHGAADHSTDESTNDIREGLGPTINALDIDLVLAGHDHAYARSFLIDTEGNQIAPEASETVVEAEGESILDFTDGTRVQLAPEASETLFVAANSASGSKYYDLLEADEYRDGFEPRFRDQQYQQNITGIAVDTCSITVTTVHLDGSVVDSVELLRDQNATDIEQTCET